MARTVKPAPTGIDIANMAVLALGDKRFNDVAGHCQMFVRQVVEAVGPPPQTIMDNYRTGTAAGTLAAFARTKYCIWLLGDTHPVPALQAGDLLYKDRRTCHYANGLPDADGHAGIVGSGSLVGLDGGVIVVFENSSYHMAHDSEPGKSGKVSGAKGWRTLKAFGPYSGIVRLT